MSLVKYMRINKFKKVGKNKYKIFLDTTELILYEDIILKYGKETIKRCYNNLHITDMLFSIQYNFLINHLDFKLRLGDE